MNDIPSLPSPENPPSPNGNPLPELIAKFYGHMESPPTSGQHPAQLNARKAQQYIQTLGKLHERVLKTIHDLRGQRPSGTEENVLGQSQFQRRMYERAARAGEKHLRACGTEALQAYPKEANLLSQSLIDIARHGQQWKKVGGHRIHSDCLMILASCPQLTGWMLKEILALSTTSQVRAALAMNPSINTELGQILLTNLQDGAVLYGLAKNPHSSQALLEAVFIHLMADTNRVDGSTTYLVLQQLTQNPSTSFAVAREARKLMGQNQPRDYLSSL